MGTQIFNLGFGDYNGDNQNFNDLTISNNDDRTKILSTVAYTVLEFSKHFDKVAIYAEGSTPARTRLYQMGINAHIEEIKKEFILLGDGPGGWQPFKKGVNYDAFLVINKN